MKRAFSHKLALSADQQSPSLFSGMPVCSLTPFYFSFQPEEERPLFRPFTRESLAQVEARIQEENEKKRELEKKRAEDGVRKKRNYHHFLEIDVNDLEIFND